MPVTLSLPTLVGNDTFRRGGWWQALGESNPSFQVENLAS